MVIHCIFGVDEIDERFGNQLMKLKIISLLRGVCTTGTSTRCREKRIPAAFRCKDLQVLADIIIAANLNGHLGKKAECNGCHGRKGFGVRGPIVNFADNHDLVLAFIKRLSHLPAFYSQNSKY